MKKRHSSFTLLEMLISIVLIGILLGFIFTYFKNSLTQKSQLVLVKEKTMRFQLLRLRLGQLFDQYREEKQCFIRRFTHPNAVGPALLLYCDNGLHPDPSYSGLVYSMLYTTRDQRLCLCTWSKDKAPKVDTLLDKVQEVSFSFFEEKKWHALWPLEGKDSPFPCMIKISILSQESQRDFIFSLPSYASILYEKKSL